MNGGEISGNNASSSHEFASAYGGGVYVLGIFRIVTGTIYGSNETGYNANVPLANTADIGAAFSSYNGTLQYGIFNGTTWNSAGTLSGGNNTIKVENGELQSQ